MDTLQQLLKTKMQRDEAIRRNIRLEKLVSELEKERDETREAISEFSRTMVERIRGM